MESSVQEHLEQTLPVAWQHNKNLGDCMIELYDKKLWTDVSFRCKGHDESERIHAHKVVLAARSPVFQAMFFGPCADGKDEVELNGAESKILDLFLRYIYRDNVSLTEENASSVLEMAHLYQVSNLVQFCADYLATIITCDNACDILTLAWRYDVTKLRDACCRFIDKNAEEILQSDGFLELSEDCLTYILKGDTFYAEESNIFVKVEELSKRKLEESNLENTGQNIRNTLGASFYYLRLPTMTYKTLMECTRKKDYFSVQEYEDIVDFINGIPDTTVKSNSCVARLPTKEILTVNNESGGTIITDTLTTSFEISVSRDVKLKTVFLSEINKCLTYDKNFYSDQNSNITSIMGDTVAKLCSDYNNKVIRLAQMGRHGKGVYKLRKITEEDLPVDLNLVISGSLRVTRPLESPILKFVRCWMAKERLQEKNEVAGDLDEIGDRPYDVEVLTDNDGDDEDDYQSLMLEQEIQLQSTDEQKVIELKKPVMFKKVGLPYTVTVNLEFSCKSMVKMKTCRSSTEAVTNQCGHIKVDNILGGFAGIKSLGFENISNRETVKETKRV